MEAPPTLWTSCVACAGAHSWVFVGVTGQFGGNRGRFALSQVIACPSWRFNQELRGGSEEMLKDRELLLWYRKHITAV